MLLEDAAASRSHLRTSIDAPRWERFAIAVLLVVQFTAIAGEAWYLGLTVDEPSHLTSSYLYWHGRDRLYPRDMPPLIKIVGGWPAALLGLPLPQDLGNRGDQRTEWAVGAELVRRLPADQCERVLFFVRLPMTLFAMLTTWLLWFWSRALFGAATAAIVASLWVFSPTPLAHSALLKNDIASTCTYLLFWYTAWRYWQSPGWKDALWLGACASLAALSKLSMLFVIAAAPCVVVLSWAVRRTPLRTALARLVALTAAMYVLLLAAFQFETRAVYGIPVPEGLWSGVASLLTSNAHDVPVYLFGQVFLRGHPLYFVIAMMLKFPWPSLILLATGVCVAAEALWRKRLQTSDVFWLLPAILYFVMASSVALQHGVRLVLPSWPFFLLIAGFGLQRLLGTRWWKPAVAALVAMQGSMTALNYPHGISHFNAYAGPPENAWRLMNDSNIDWGQGLPALRDYLRSNPTIDRLQLAYFGFDNPGRYFNPARVEVLTPPWSAEWAHDSRLKPAAGWYAISASLLPGHFFASNYRDYYAEFQRRKPIATVGGSIFIYRLD